MKKAVTMLVFCVASLLALGIVMLYSSSMANDSAHFLIMQLVWCGLGLIFCMSALAVDYRVLKKFAWPLFALTVLLLVLVLVPGIGLKVKGARRWLGYGCSDFNARSCQAGADYCACLVWRTVSEANAHLEKGHPCPCPYY